MDTRLCIFDLDGTILYTLDSIARAGNRMLRELGRPEQPVDSYRYFCGDGSDILTRRALAASGGVTEEDLARGCILNRKYIAEYASYHVRPYEGIPEALEALRAAGETLAVFSNKPHEAAGPAVRNAFGDGLFSHIRGQIAGIPPKPAPDGALGIARHFGARPEDCLYFGDSRTDMRTGRAAGMYTVGVLWGYRDEKELVDNGADELVRTPSELVTAAARFRAGR